ncbi:MAG: hypothetical protein GY822_26790 [Deltaproteobacteria bacterium]|nr:hypothetical protein [Deltaproteobacteria bacterium]
MSDSNCFGTLDGRFGQVFYDGGHVAYFATAFLNDVCRECPFSLCLPTTKLAVDDVDTGAANNTFFDAGTAFDDAGTSFLDDGISPTDDAGEVFDAGPRFICEAGTWDYDADAYTACVAHGDCDAGDYILQLGDVAQDVECASCRANTYSTMVNSSECIRKTACIAGQAAVDEGSRIADRVCGECSEGSFSPNGLECILWTVCEAGQRVFAKWYYCRRPGVHSL